MVKQNSIWVAGLLYTLMTAVFFAPCLPALSTALIGPPEDNLQFYWFLWHGSEALLRADLPLMHTKLIYYPEGVSLFYANYFYFGVLITALLKWLLPLPLIFNLLVLSSFPLAGMGAFLLCRYLMRPQTSGTPQTSAALFSACLMGGYVFAFNPSHVAHALHHVTIASIQFIPFFVLFYLKAVRGESRRAVLWAALCLTASALCDWNYLIYGALFIGAHVAYRLWRDRGAHRISLPVRSAGIFVLSLVILSPLLVPMIQAGRMPFKTDLPGHDVYVADLFGFLTPHPLHALGEARWISDLNDKMTGTPWEKTVYLGLGLVGLTAAFWRRLPGTARLCLGAAAFFAIFALGVRLHTAGTSLPVPLPYEILRSIPFLKQARNPSRVVVYVYLFWSVLAAFSFRALMDWAMSSRLKKGLGTALTLIVFLDFFSICGATTPVTLPKAYEVLRRDTERDFGVLDLPWNGGLYMMYQTLHGRPEVQGYIGRRSETTLGDRLVMDLRRLPEQRRMLVENKVKYIILHTRKADWRPWDPRHESYVKLMHAVAQVYAATYPKVYEDDEAVVYRVY